MTARRVSRALYCAAALLAVLFASRSRVLRPQSVNWSSPPSKPPVAPVRPVTDNYHGTKVTDPYRYIENLADPEVQAWIKGQNDHARAALARIPGRKQLLARIQELDRSVQKVEAARLPGDLYLILKQLPGENVAKLYLRRGLNGQDKLLVDPGKVTLAPVDQGKGKNVIDGSAVSENGQYVAGEY